MANFRVLRSNITRSRTLVAVALFFWSLPAAPQSGAGLDVHFRHLTPEHGLSQSHVFAILQDRYGFLWFGTEEGLNRYDGSSFRVFSSDESTPAPLLDNTIRALAEDAEGGLWIATNEGLSRLDPARQRVSNYLYASSNVSSPGADSVRAVFRDSNGTIWAARQFAGLARYDEASDGFVQYRHDPTDNGTIGSDEVWSIAQAEGGALWVGTRNGLNRMDPETGMFSRIGTAAGSESILAETHCRALLSENGGSILWIGTERDGLLRYDSSTGVVRRYKHDEADKTSISAGQISSIYRDKAGNLWVGTGHGLNLYKQDTDAFSRFVHDAKDDESLSHSTVKVIFEDRGGLLWIGTYNGLSNRNANASTMRHLQNDPANPASLSHNSVFALAEDRRGRIWMGTQGGGLSIFDREAGSFTTLDEVPGARADSPLPSVMALAFGDGDDVWIGTRDSGLARLRTTDNRLETYRHSETDDASLSADGVTSILRTRDGTIWAATFFGGLNRYVPETNRFLRYLHKDADNSTGGPARVLTLLEDSNGGLWYGTYGSGLGRLDPDTGYTWRIAAKPDDPNGLSGSDIYVLLEDSDGNFWIGTQGAGLNLWAREDRLAGREIFTRLNESHGLPSNTIYSGVFDENGQLWVGTLDGLAVIDTHTFSIRSFDISHGLQGREFNLSAALRARDGQLFFGGVNGVNAFYPVAIDQPRDPPPVALTSFAINNDKGYGNRRLSDRGGLELGHRDLLLTFEYAALDFAAPERNQYRYKLDGLDDDWVDAGNRRIATYTNLSPGRYTFRMIAANNDGVWNEAGLIAPFVVRAAPWRTWWAYAIYSLMLGLAGIAALRMHSVRLREAAVARYARELEAVNEELAQEIDARREKETALQLEKERAQSYFDVADVVLLVADEQGRVRLINRKGSRLLERPVEQIVGQYWLQFVPPEWRSVASEAFTAAPRPDDRLVEYPIVGRDGSEHLVAWNFTALAAPGRPSLTLGSGMDITQLRNLEKQVRFREKMNAVGTLAGGIAHDFNNILQAIYGFTSLALDSGMRQDERAEYLRHVIQGTERARELVRRMLTFSTQKEHELKPIDIGPVVTEACAFLRGSLPSNIELRVVIDEELHPVRADPTRIHQVIMNLGANAGHAIGDGGGVIDVVVEQCWISGAEQGEGRQLSPGPHVVLRVRDTGCGMDEAIMDRVFDPFFTTKDVGEGTGLGLSVVHGIVENHGGIITVNSAPVRGTTFTVTLPCCDTVPSASSPVTAVVHAGDETILVVDDEVSVANVTRKILENRGFSVRVAYSAAEALDLLRGDPQFVDLVITDEAMPKMTGSELVREIRRFRKGLPVVVISGRHAPAIAEEPNTYFLQKPCTVDEIGRTVRRALDEAVQQGDNALDVQNPP